MEGLASRGISRTKGFIDPLMEKTEDSKKPAYTMSKNDWSEVCGFMSLGCSSFFWAAHLLRFLGIAPHLALSFYFYLGQWVLAVVLALIAAALSSYRWAYAALLPIFNWLVSYYLVGG